MERITRVVKSLADDGVERGVDLNRPVHCDSCGTERNSAGSALYGAYKVCNECLLDFTLALASGAVDTVADYMTKRTDVTEGQPPSTLSTREERPSLARGPLTARDKLLPHNEPC